jgi:hypothetical protein
MNLPFPNNVLRDLAQTDPHAVEQLAGFGPNIFNPIIGTTPAETCSNIAMVADVVVDLLNGQESLVEVRKGVALIVQSIWYAALYEGGRDGGAKA